MAKGKHILITRPLDADLEAMFLHSGHRIEGIAFIETSPLQDRATGLKIRQAGEAPHTIVFTSMNAVQAVADHLNGIDPAWDIYAIGHATLEHVQGSMLGATIKGTAPDAARLAERIIADRPIKPVLFFCGDQRREELPKMLQQAGIGLQELVVYHTIERPIALEPVHDALMFFSPSAVKSYFSVNRPKDSAVFFAIGGTTAAAIREHVRNEVVISPEPSAAALAQVVIGHLTEH